ncbi:MAG: DUF2304 domain-containing protein [archaeon]
MVLGIQIVGVFFGVLIIYMTFLHRKRKEFTLHEFVFWTALGLVFSYVSLFPDTLDFVVRKIQLSRTLDFFIILGFMFLIGAAFYTYSIVRRVQKKLEEVVRSVALKEPRKS